MTVKMKEKRVSYHGFTKSALGEEKLICGYDAFNTDCRDGKLATGTGARFIEDAFKNNVVVGSGISVQRVFQGVVKTEDENLETVYFVVANTGAVIMFQSGKGWIVMDSIAPFECITLREIHGEIWNVLLTATGVYVVKNFGVVEKSEEMDCLAGCVAGERIFYGCKNGEIRYSAPGNPTLVSDTVEEGGSLFLPVDGGEISAMRSVGKRVYVFCERAIYVMITQAKANEFVVKRVPYSGGRIVRNGAAVLGESVVILAEDGAYLMTEEQVKKAFDGLNFGRVELARGCQYGCFEGKVTFTYFVREGQKNIRRCVTLYADGKDGFFGDVYDGLSGAESGALFVKNKAIMAFGGAVDVFSSAPTFRARTTDFGVCAKKKLKKICLYGTGKVTIVVECEQGRREYTLAFQNGRAETALVESGFAFSFTFRPTFGSVVEGADVEFLYAGE